MFEAEEYVLTDKQNNKRYLRKRLLGTGGFAKCFEVSSLADGQIYAAKVIPKKNVKEKRQRYKLLLEIKLHRGLSHRNIVNFHQVFEDKQNIYIILEHCPNRTLKSMVKRRRRLTQLQTRIYTLQLIRALQYIHSHNIIHRDLKLGNILIDEDMQLKIIDFGLSTRINQKGQKKKTVCGTPNYIAPEILQEQGHSFEVDVWSLGVIIYTLAVGKPPYQDNTVEATYQNIRNNNYSFPEIGLSHEFKDLIEKILVLDPYKRLTLDEILAHDFMQPLERIPKSLPRYALAIPHVEPPGQENLRTPRNKNNNNYMMAADYIVSEDYPQDQYYRSLTIDKSIIIKYENQNQKETQREAAMMGENSLAELDFSVRNQVRNSQPREYSNTYVINSARETTLNNGLNSTARVNRKMNPNLIYIKDCLVSDGDVGFLLSNGIMGAYFPKDKTSMILQYDEKYFVYVGRNEETKKIVTSKYNVGILDEKVEWKYEKMTYFISFFKMKYYNDMFDKMRKRYKDIDLELIYIKKLIRFTLKNKNDDSGSSKNSGDLLVRLSNGVIQLRMTDMTSVIINRNEDQEIYFVDREEKEHVYFCDEIAKLPRNSVKAKIQKFSRMLESICSGGQSSQYRGEIPKGGQDRSPGLTTPPRRKAASKY